MKNFDLSFYTRYQRKPQNQIGIFVVEEHNWFDVNTVQCWRKSLIEDGRQKPEVEMKQRNISASKLDSNEIPKATPILSGSSNSMELVWTLSDIGVSGKSKIAAIDRK